MINNDGRYIYRLISRKTNDLVAMGTSIQLSEFLGLSHFQGRNVLQFGTPEYKAYKVVKLFEYEGEVGTREELAAGDIGMTFKSTYEACRRGQFKLVGHRLDVRGFDTWRGYYAVYRDDDCLCVGKPIEIIANGWVSPRGFYEIFRGKRKNTNLEIIKLED